MTTVDETRYALVSKEATLTYSGLPEVYATTVRKGDLTIFARNVYGKYWKRYYKIVPVKELSKPVLRR